ncbi:MAG TPA: glutathione S-transferase family protein [Alphaproteobacteria bacterium]|jgi:glutathione S-transferase
MADLTIVLANKAYSSWSLRGWLALKATGAAFEEIVIPLKQPDTRTEILKYSPSGKLPALIDGEVTVWESLAIIEYLAEKFPKAGLWPADVAARAEARAVAAEVHAGFLPLRRAMPMAVLRKVRDFPIEDAVRDDINRIQAIWRGARRRFGAGGPYLFGGFSGADCMFAPVVSRFQTFDVALEDQAAEYVATMMAHPSMVEWIAGAEKEPWFIPDYEPGVDRG